MSEATRVEKEVPNGAVYCADDTQSYSSPHSFLHIVNILKY